MRFTYENISVLPILGYMELEPRTGTVGMYAPMSTPEFYASKDHCLQFNYNLWVVDSTLTSVAPPSLEVYVRTSDHVYSGRRLWRVTGINEGRALIRISAISALSCFIDFVGIVGDPASTLIRVANVALNAGSCHKSDHMECSARQYKCLNSMECISESQTCDGIPNCMDESDELSPICGKQNMNTVNKSHILLSFKMTRARLVSVRQDGTYIMS